MSSEYLEREIVMGHCKKSVWNIRKYRKAKRQLDKMRKEISASKSRQNRFQPRTTNGQWESDDVTVSNLIGG